MSSALTLANQTAGGPVNSTIQAKPGEAVESFQPVVPARTGALASATDVFLVGTDGPNTCNQVTFQVSGTYNGVNAVFETTSDGVNWTPTFAIRRSTGVVATSTGALTNTVDQYVVEAGGVTAVRMRATAWVSGSMVVTALLSQEDSGSIVAIVNTPNVSVSNSPSVNPAAPTSYTLNSTATTNLALIQTGTRGLQSFYATNIGATAAFVKLYNKATAPVSTDIPVMIIPVPAAVSGIPGVAQVPIGFSGQRFPLGLGIAITGAVADNDTTAVAAAQVKVALTHTA